MQIVNDSLQNQLTATQWSNVSSISYIDVDVAWSTIDFQQISLMYTDPVTYETRAGQLSGNYPAGTLLYIRSTLQPSTHVAWSKSDVASWRSWFWENDNAIDATHRGVFIQSVTETVGYQYNGSSCP